MSESVKNYLGIAAAAILLIFAYAAMSYVNSYSQSIEPSAFRSFTVSGEGKITAIPDVAQFTFSIITEGGKDPEGKQASYGAGIAKLQKENTEKGNKIIGFIKSQSVEDKDIKTQNYNLEPRYQYFNCYQPMDGKSKSCPPPEIVGYTIRQTVSIKVRDFAKIGDILAGVVENGANFVSQLSFEIDDIDKIKNQAREEAIKKAKEKAESIAKAGDFRLGKLLSIEEEGFAPTPYYLKNMELSPMDAGGLPSPTIEPGSQEVTVNIVLKYEIK